MDDYTREMMDLKTLVTRTIEKKGILAKIRAELRASVFEAIEEEDRAVEKDGLPPALLGSCNEQAKQLHASPSVQKPVNPKKTTARFSQPKRGNQIKSKIFEEFTEKFIDKTSGGGLGNSKNLISGYAEPCPPLLSGNVGVITVTVESIAIKKPVNPKKTTARFSQPKRGNQIKFKIFEEFTEKFINLTSGGGLGNSNNTLANRFENSSFPKLVEIRMCK